MKKIIIFCTITLCGVICAVGYFVACASGNGAKSSPGGYLDIEEGLVVAFFAIIAIISLILAIKDLKKWEYIYWLKAKI